MGNKALLGHRDCLPDHSFPNGSILETPKLRARSPELAEVSSLRRKEVIEEINKERLCQKSL